MPYKITIFLGLSLAITLPFITDVLGANTKHRVEQENLYRRSEGRRIEPSSSRKCESCESKVALTRAKYLKRVLLSNQPEGYESAIEAKLFEDEKFAAKCWDKNTGKGIDLFFTVSESGAAKDIVWFPKNRSAKCIKRHVKSIDFPPTEKPHYAWFVINSRGLK